MSPNEDDNLRYLYATAAEEFKVVRHNETDFGAFNDFTRTLDERFATLENERSREERLKNVRKWDSMLAQRWRGASLRSIDNPAAGEAEALLRKHGYGSFYIQGGSMVGKTYLAHAIVRRYIGLGWITPSQVLTISEENLLSTTQMGFEGHALFARYLKSDYKLYLFDSVGQRDVYDPRRDLPQWEKIIDHVYSQSLAAIFTSTFSADSFSNVLPGSVNYKFRHLIEDKEITMKGNGLLPRLKEASPEDRERDARLETAHERNKSLAEGFSEKRKR